MGRDMAYADPNTRADADGAGAQTDGRERTYLCIDLKSFYASVECVERGLDPLEAHLVVADESRGPTTICLAVSPALKKLGVRNRCRVFEIPKGIEYLMAQPRMRLYMEVSAKIYATYLRYVSPDDVHVYSIDECFIDATPYLALYGTDARSFAVTLMGAVREQTGIPATAGIGPNLFLAKVALDVSAKHAHDGIGWLDEAEFRRTIWHHRPITDIWNIGPGIARRLEKYGVHDLAGVALMPPQVLYREFGVNAEYLIDHAWGVEPCTIRQIHDYQPKAHSLMNGQILPSDYTFEEARVVLKEMVDALALDLAEKGLVCDQVSLHVGYSRHGSAGRPDDGSSPDDGQVGAARGQVFVGEHGAQPVGGRMGPHAGGSRRLPQRTDSYRVLISRLEGLYDERVDPARRIRRISIGFGGLMPREYATVDLFTDLGERAREHDLQQAVLAVKRKFGKNALLRGMSLTEKATARERNEQIGGHHA